VRLLKSTRLR